MCTENSLKTVILGAAGVGKTSLSHYLREKKFVKSFHSTIGAQLFVSKLEHAGDVLTLEIWDTSGDPQFHAMSEAYILNSRIVFFVFTVDNRASFDEVKELWEKHKETIEPDARIYLIGNAIDRGDRQVSHEDAKNFANTIKVRYFEASIKEGKGIFGLIEALHFDFYDEPVIHNDRNLVSIPIAPSSEWCLIA